MKKLIKPHHNQIMHGALFACHWARHQLINEPLKLRKGAQDAKAEFLEQGFVFIRYLLLQGRQDVTQ